MFSKQRNSLKLAFSFFITFFMASLGGILSRKSLSNWYNKLKKPFFNPPNSFFMVVWTCLYFLMSIANYLVWKKGINHKYVKHALMAYASELIMNLGWTILFFTLRWPFGGLILNILIIVSSIRLLFIFRKVSYLGALLLIPYVVWVSFAGVLNFSIWRLNR